jgi:GH35 family endo-1,4-beta-xylanase
MAKKNIFTDLQKRTGSKSTDRLLLMNPETKAVQYVELGDLSQAGGGGSSAVNQPMEVELVTSRPAGKISSETGAFATSTTDHVSGFIAVTPGEKILIRYRSSDFNPSPPAIVTGICGYSAANYGSFVTTKDAAGFPIGNIFNLYRFNAENGTSVEGAVDFIDVIRTIPAGANFVNGSSANGVPISIKAIRNTGTLEQSLKQIYDKVNTKPPTSGNTGGSGSSNDFTDEMKNKLQGIQTPTAHLVEKENGNAIQFTDVATGLPFLGFVKNGAWVIEGNTKTLRSFPYPVGFSAERDKLTSTYTPAFNDAAIVTGENGFGPSIWKLSGAYDFTEADAVMDFAISKGITRFHNAHLTWHHAENIPASWKKVATDNPGNEKAALTAQLKIYIPTVINHFKTKYPNVTISWNVMNEAITNSGTQTPCMWADYFTLDELFEITFTAARQADRTIDLAYNDYNFENSGGARTTTLIGCMNTLKAKNIMVAGRRVEVDMIGSQMHTFLAIAEAGTEAMSVGGIDFFRASLKRLADTGAKILITELDFKTGKPYDAAKAERLANAYYNVFLTYERAVPAAQRAGIVIWSTTDRYSYINVNKGYTAPDGSNPPNDYPALYDWWGQKKLAYDRLLTLLDRPQLNADVYQDFMVANPITDITGTYTGGKTPLQWKKTGYTGGNIEISEIGINARQTSQNSSTIVYMDYPYRNRTLITRLNRIPSSTRTTIILIKYQDTNNFLAVQATNTDKIWVLFKRVDSNDTRLIETTVAPTKKDEIKVTTIGDKVTLYINGQNMGTVTEGAFQDSLSAGFRFKGFDDKFSSYEDIMLHKI